MSLPPALIIEDDPALSRAYQRVLVDLGYRVEIANSVADARLQVRNFAPALILVDIELPDGNGLDLMDELRNSTKERFIVISGNSSQVAAIKSIRHRAVEYIVKPVSLSDLKRSVGKAISDVTEQSNPDISPTIKAPSESNPERQDCWINHGDSPSLVELRTALSFSAELRKGHALIIGEAGLEKCVIAMELHKRSRRKGKIAFLDCASQANIDLQTELFGTFSSANETIERRGCIDTAAGGTLVLQNVDYLSQELQSSISLFLDTGTFKRAGSEQGFNATIAVVGILSDQSKLDSLKKDFALRIGKVSLYVPSLRDCVGDVAKIARWLLEQIKPPKSGYTLSDSMSAQISEARWPGNVRELRDSIQMAIDHSASSELPGDELHLPEALQNNRWDPLDELVGLTLRDFSKGLVLATLAHHHGEKVSTAKTLGISLKTLYNRLNSY